LFEKAIGWPGQEDRKHNDVNDYSAGAASSVFDDCVDIHQQNLRSNGLDLAIFNFGNSRKVSGFNYDTDVYCMPISIVNYIYWRLFIISF
jgi:hypothetical protein